MQIPDEIRKCVVFLSYLDKEGKKPLKGTGFFVNIPSDDQSVSFVYLVTARHVIASIIEKELSQDGNIWIRINKKESGFDFISVPIKDFVPHPDSVDVTILPVAPDISIYDYLTLPHKMLVTEDIIRRENISLGDEVFMTGLFLRHFGKQRNIPIVRAGNISAMPEEQIYLKNFGEGDGYLIELRSLGGLSGSPVFVHLSGNRITSPGVSSTFVGQHRFYVLGLLHGHWTLDNAIEDVITEDYPDEGRSAINTGIGIAIPSVKILEALNQDCLEQQRKEVMTNK